MADFPIEPRKHSLSQMCRSSIAFSNSDVVFNQVSFWSTSMKLMVGLPGRVLPFRCRPTFSASTSTLWRSSCAWWISSDKSSMSSANIRSVTIFGGICLLFLICSLNPSSSNSRWQTCFSDYIIYYVTLQCSMGFNLFPKLTWLITCWAPWSRLSVNRIHPNVFNYFLRICIIHYFWRSMTMASNFYEALWYTIGKNIFFIQSWHMWFKSKAIEWLKP